MITWVGLWKMHELQNNYVIIALSNAGTVKCPYEKNLLKIKNDAAILKIIKKN